MADFNLRFLNGVGEAYDRESVSYRDLENKTPLQKDDYQAKEDAETPSFDSYPEPIERKSNETKETEKRTEIGRILLWMLVGACGGQLLRKLFKD